MAKNYKEQYYTLEEEEMQALINRAKSGEMAAQEELLKVFDNFLSKYVTMLYHGKYRISDYDMRKFLALFVKDANIRRFLLRNNLNSEGFKHVNECLRGIRYMILRYGEEEDVRQTVEMTFLHCVSNYNRKESKQGGYVPFSGYLWNYFYYLLKKNVDVFLIDQLGRKTFPLIAEPDGEGGEDGEVQEGFVAPPEPGADELLGPEEIDEFWVMGDSALSPFDQLTIQERQLLKWRYVDGKRSSEIAKKITEHPNTVREHFNKIRAKVQETMDEEMSG